MQILECSFDYIEIDKIKIVENRGNENNTYFTDGHHTYHFSISKNTLYMIFENLELLDVFTVDIVADPYALLMAFDLGMGKISQKFDYMLGGEVLETSVEKVLMESKEQLCLPLYSRKGSAREKFVAEKSGLNQWNASGRKRDPNELYIPYQTIDRGRNPEFFPPRDIPFNLHLPDGTEISAKVCQEADKNNPKIGKAIMSNPNKILGKWLLRDVFEIEEGTIITYEMLEKFGVDSVVFTKNDELDYSVDFSPIGTYEKMYGLLDEGEESEV